jgi:hypothetical protein
MISKERQTRPGKLSGRGREIAIGTVLDVLIDEAHKCESLMRLSHWSTKENALADNFLLALRLVNAEQKANFIAAILGKLEVYR